MFIVFSIKVDETYWVLFQIFIGFNCNKMHFCQYQGHHSTMGCFIESIIFSHEVSSSREFLAANCLQPQQYKHGSFCNVSKTAFQIPQNLYAESYRVPHRVSQNKCAQQGRSNQVSLPIHHNTFLCIKNTFMHRAVSVLCIWLIQ